MTKWVTKSLKNHRRKRSKNWFKMILRKDRHKLSRQFSYLLPRKRRGQKTLQQQLKISPMYSVSNGPTIFPKMVAFRRMMISMTTSMIRPMPGGMYQMPDKYLRIMGCSSLMVAWIRWQKPFGGVKHSYVHDMDEINEMIHDLYIFRNISIYYLYLMHI